MANQLNVTKTLNDDIWEVTCELSDSSSLPKEIFVYTNTGTTQLGAYYGTCSVDELNRLRIFSGTSIKLFGNKFVRYPQVKIQVKISEDIDSVIERIVLNIRKLSNEYSLKSSSSYTLAIN